MVNTAGACSGRPKMVHWPAPGVLLTAGVFGAGILKLGWATAVFLTCDVCG